MSGDTLKRVKSVKRWLEKAENSYSNHKELTGEMNLIMAQAEMQRLKEVRGTSPRRKWLLRATCSVMTVSTGAGTSSAFCTASSTGFGVSGDVVTTV